MDKRWVIKEPGDAAIEKALSQELNISRQLARLLVQRGIKTFEEAKSFFRPELCQLHDPFLMKDMDLAISQNRKSYKEKRKDTCLRRLRCGRHFGCSPCIFVFQKRL